MRTFKKTLCIITIILAILALASGCNKNEKDDPKKTPEVTQEAKITSEPTVEPTAEPTAKPTEEPDDLDKASLLKRIITINKDNIDKDLKDFPVLIKIDQADVFEKAMAHGENIAFYSGTDNSSSELAFEIQSWDKDKKIAYVWVKVPSISASVDTNIALYYPIEGKTENTDFRGNKADTVWSDKYEMVMHMNLDKAGSFINSADSNFNGSLVGDSSIVYTPSPIDKGVFFTDGEYYISVDKGVMDVNEAFTASFMMNLDDINSNYPNPVGFGSLTNAMNRIAFHLFANDHSMMRFGTSLNNTWTKCDAGDVIYFDEWIYVTGVYDSNEMRLYINGELVQTLSVSGTLTDYGADFSIGCDIEEGNPRYPFDGALAEVRLASTDRADEYIKAEYMNIFEMDKFLTIDKRAEG